MEQIPEGELNMSLSDSEARGYMYDIDRILGKFWVEGFISSYDRTKILEQFPPILKSMLE
jgi:hypothetical protein